MSETFQLEENYFSNTDADVARRIANGDVAYDKIVLHFVMGNIGAMCEFATQIMGYPLDLFLGMFAKSRIAKRMSDGDQRILGGKTGTEIAYAVEEEIRGCVISRGHELPPLEKRSRVYGFGQALAYYQWYSKIPWADLFTKVSVHELLRAYLFMTCGSYPQYCVKVDRLVCKRGNEHSSPYAIWNDMNAYEMEVRRLSCQKATMLKRSVRLLPSRKGWALRMASAKIQPASTGDMPEYSLHRRRQRHRRTRFRLKGQVKKRFAKRTGVGKTKGDRLLRYTQGFA